MRGVTVCNMYCFYALLGPLYPASRFISNTHSHLPEMSIVRQNSGTKTPAVFPGWPAAEGTAVEGGRQWDMAFCPRKYSVLPAKKMAFWKRTAC